MCVGVLNHAPDGRPEVTLGARPSSIYLCLILLSQGPSLNLGVG